MSELGIYILGATALAILAAAGIASGESAVVAFAVFAAGAAYLAQLLGEAVEVMASRKVWYVHVAAMVSALAFWLAGAVLLIA